LQGTVEAVGTFTQLKGSGQLDFARQLDLELVETKESNLIVMNISLPVHCNAQHSVNKWQRQDSESSCVVSWIVTMDASMKTFPI
jgi:hypothetical protein